jgi:HisA/HisF family protein
LAQFLIIPVIDLKGGLAVRGVGGNRADYRPLDTPLCPDGDPLRAARGLMEVCPTPVLYLADLDAIEGRPAQHAVIGRLSEAFPETDFWVDGGFTGAEAIEQWQFFGKARPVLGSETLGEDVPYFDAATVLSLDFRGDRFVGPPALLAQPSRWPQDVIAMCLQSVGASGGPDFERVRSIVKAAAGKDVYAAGGVRHRADLDALSEAGVAGVLISSALHNGAITRADVVSAIDQHKSKGRPKPPLGDINA